MLSTRFRKCSGFFFVSSMDLLIIWLSCITLYVCECRMVVPSFHWNPRNPLFKITVPRKLCTDPAHLYVEPRAELYFICPHIAIDVEATKADRPSRDELYENIHLVSKQGYDTCTIDRPDSLLINCDKSVHINQLKFELLIFSPVTWNEWEFFPNKTYYFIDTSDGTKKGLNNKSGGRCQTHNMKLKVTVCLSSEKCGKCKGMCCEKPPTTQPPTTQSTSTVKITNTTLLPMTMITNSRARDSVLEDTESWTAKPVSKKVSVTNASTARVSVPLTKLFVAKIHSTIDPTTPTEITQRNITRHHKARFLKSSDDNRTNSTESTRDRVLFTGCGMVIGVLLTILAFFSRRKCRKNRTREKSLEESAIKDHSDV